MPVYNGHDSKGSYYKWGSSGKKYYYVGGNEMSRNAAKRRATKQGQAIHVNKAK